MCQENKHVGFHRVVSGRSYNQDCPECRKQEFKCPIGQGKNHCWMCLFEKEGLCDYPNSRLEPIWNSVPLEILARIRNEAQDKLESIVFGWLNAI